jgi:hypothetical protein
MTGARYGIGYAFNPREMTMRFLLPLMLLIGLSGCAYEPGYAYGGGYPYGGYGYGYTPYYQPGYVFLGGGDSYRRPDWRGYNERSYGAYRDRDSHPETAHRQREERRNEHASGPAPHPGGNITVMSHGKPDYNPGGSSDRQ